MLGLSSRELFYIAFSPFARHVVLFEEPTGWVECVDVINDASCDLHLATLQLGLVRLEPASPVVRNFGQRLRL